MPKLQHSCFSRHFFVKWAKAFLGFTWKCVLYGLIFTVPLRHGNWRAAWLTSNESGSTEALSSSFFFATFLSSWGHDSMFGSKLTFSRKQKSSSVFKQSFRAIEVVWSFFFGQKKKVSKKISKKVSNFRATTRLKMLATQAITGPETVSKQHRRNSLWGMYTLMAVYVLFFNRFIDLMLNFHTNPNKLAPVGCCESGCPVSQPKTTTCNWNLITSSAGQCSVKIPATTPCYLKVGVKFVVPSWSYAVEFAVWSR